MDTRRNNGVVLHNIQTTKSENVWKVIYNYSAPEDFMQYVVDKEESLLSMVQWTFSFIGDSR